MTPSGPGADTERRFTSLHDSRRCRLPASRLSRAAAFGILPHIARPVFAIAGRAASIEQEPHIAPRRLRGRRAGAVKRLARSLRVRQLGANERHAIEKVIGDRILFDLVSAAGWLRLHPDVRPRKPRYQER